MAISETDTGILSSSVTHGSRSTFNSATNLAAPSTELTRPHTEYRRHNESISQLRKKAIFVDVVGIGLASIGIGAAIVAGPVLGAVLGISAALGLAGSISLLTIDSLAYLELMSVESQLEARTVTTLSSIGGMAAAVGSSASGGHNQDILTAAMWGAYIDKATQIALGRDAMKGTIEILHDNFDRDIADKLDESSFDSYETNWARDSFLSGENLSFEREHQDTSGMLGADTTFDSDLDTFRAGAGEFDSNKY